MDVLAENRKARFDYEIKDAFEAGVELLGGEVKSIKQGHFQLAGSYAVLKGSELWLLNSEVPPYQPKNTSPDYDSKRSRRLLLHKEEIKSLIGKLKEKGITLVPLKAYSKKGIIKIELGLAKSRKTKDKRELLKKRAVEKELRS